MQNGQKHQAKTPLRSFLEVVLRIFRKPVFVSYLHERPSDKWVDEEAIASLQGNVGFESLRNRLAMFRATIETQLLTRKQESLREVDALQIGLYWMGFLDREMDRVAKRNRRVVVDATEEEEARFKQIYAAIEGVCSSQD